jgi:hypothetical protein
MVALATKLIASFRSSSFRVGYNRSLRFSKGDPAVSRDTFRALRRSGRTDFRHSRSTPNHEEPISFNTRAKRCLSFNLVAMLFGGRAMDSRGEPVEKFMDSHGIASLKNCSGAPPRTSNGSGPRCPRLGIEFYQPYERILDTSRVAWPSWCCGGK